MEHFVIGFLFGVICLALLAGAVFAAQGHRIHTWLTTNSESVQVHTGADGVKIAMVRLDETRPAIVTVGGLIEFAAAEYEEAR